MLVPPLNEPLGRSRGHREFDRAELSPTCRQPCEHTRAKDGNPQLAAQQRFNPVMLEPEFAFSDGRASRGDVADFRALPNLRMTLRALRSSQASTWLRDMVRPAMVATTAGVTSG